MPEETLTSRLQPLNDDIIFADDDRETMIRVDHVSMEFNMASEKLNSLKEYFIAIAKHNLYFERFTALDDISFEVKKGDVFGILGTNGSGKSTLLKIIAGVLEPTKGSCEIHGNIAPLIELGAGFDMELSARENIYLNGSLLGYSKSFIEEHFNDIVEFAEIEKFLDMPMKNYSSGMVARIAFAIATVIVPEILIVDEVLSVGDFMFQQKCEDRINELIEKYGVTVLIVSHNTDQIERLCNKAIWIEKGHVRILGDAMQVCNAYRVLGGRTGSAENEHLIYCELQKAETSDSNLSINTVNGFDHYQIATSCAHIAWNSECRNIVLLQCNTHVFTITASGIAGALNAPVLPFDNTEIHESVISTIRLLNPDNIIVIAHNDIAKTISQSVLSLEIPNVSVITITCENGCSGIFEPILKYGHDNKLWQSDIAFLAHFDDVGKSFALSSLSYKTKSPFLIAGKEPTKLNELASKMLTASGIKKFYMLHNEKLNDIVSSIKINGFEIVDIDLGTIELFGWVASFLNKEKTAVCLADSHLSRWQNLISLSSFCGNKDLIPLLLNTDDLDNVAYAIKSKPRFDVNKSFVLTHNSFPSILIKALFFS